MPEQPYLVTDKHLRRVGKDALVSFEASFYSVPARRIRAGQRVQLQVDGEAVTIRSLPTDTGPDTGPEGGGWLVTHPRARERGSWVVDPAHWDGLPDGHTRAVVIEQPGRPTPSPLTSSHGGLEPLSSLLARRHADITVAARPLSDYESATHTNSNGAHR